MGEDVVEVLVEDAHVDLRLEPFAKEKYESLEYHISNFSKPAAHRILEFIKNRKNPEKSNKIFNPPSFPEWSEFWDRSKVAIVLAGKAYVETPSTDTNTKLEASNDKRKKMNFVEIKLKKYAVRIPRRSLSKIESTLKM